MSDDSMDALAGKSIREKMIAFLRKHDSETLGGDAALLDRPDALERLHRKYCRPRGDES